MGEEPVWLRRRGCWCGDTGVRRTPLRCNRGLVPQDMRATLAWGILRPSAEYPRISILRTFLIRDAQGCSVDGYQPPAIWLSGRRCLSSFRHCCRLLSDCANVVGEGEEVRAKIGWVQDHEITVQVEHHIGQPVQVVGKPMQDHAALL